MSENIWTGKDDEGNQCELDRLRDGSFQWSATEGNFRGYPTTNLAQESLKELFNKLKEIFEPDICTAWIADDLLFVRPRSDQHFHKCIKHTGHKPVEARTPTHKCSCNCEWVNTQEEMG